MTSAQPSSSSELQLYRVLQRANLLQYYDMFISQGGDDVQQLCEAGEEEFLEIMALVGMASKPLHVRRLQKALQEWVTNPSVFHQSLTSSTVNAASPGSIAASAGKTSQVSTGNGSPHSSTVVTATATWKPKTAELLSIPSPGPRDLEEGHSREDRKSPVPVPVLVEDQIAMIAQAADQLVPTLGYYAPKPMNMKKEINREIDYVLNLPIDAENRMDLLRKYSAIYGRFDSKRKGEKPMSMHEISVNEAAAQICRHMPSLLTRRDELFPLARQVVRESGYQYSKGHSRAQGEPTPKKSRLDNDYQESNGAEFDKTKIEARMQEINHALQQIAEIQDQIKHKIEEAKTQEDYDLIHELQSSLEECAGQQLKLLTEQAELMRKEKRSQKKSMEPSALVEDNDSANYSNASSPPETDDRPDILNIPIKKQDSRQFVQETLFDEGLRIAQQYGMADFAEELIGLKPKVVPLEGAGNDSTDGADNEKVATEDVMAKETSGGAQGKIKMEMSDENSVDASAEGTSANGSEHVGLHQSVKCEPDDGKQ